MRRFFISAFLIIYVLSAAAQSNATELSAQMNDFNSFQDFLYTKPNVDSAVKCLQRMGSRTGLEKLLIDLIDDSFALSFDESEEAEKDTARIARKRRYRQQSFAILQRLRADEPNSKTVLEIAQPLTLLIEAKEAQGDITKLKAIADQFTTAESRVKYPVDTRYARYGLKLVAILSHYPELKHQYITLQDKLHMKLKLNQITMTDTSTRAQLEMRARLRYLYAYSNYIKAQTINTPPAEKERLLKAAFDFSPDLADKNHYSAYFYDMISLLGTEKESFKPDYLAYITQRTTKTAELVPILLGLALVEPTYKDTLQAFYLRQGNSLPDFKKYWSKSINANAKAASRISLTMTNANIFSSEERKGRWIVVDFWGTWCGPCREEHPDLQKFYDSVVKRNPERISLITIACRDNIGAVTKYMNEKTYSFPVAMSDNEIEHTFNVQGYPTKILITPEGKAIVIPYNCDFTTFIRKYADI
jgi:thiol-disulfide isomerase/thioredoxin